MNLLKDNMKGGPVISDVDLELIDLVTNSDIHMSRAIFNILAFDDLQAIITWYGDRRPPNLLMNRRNVARLLALSSVGLPISNKAEREKQASIAKELIILKLSQFKKAIKT
jgi:hypothetical protein